jgi:hypothetical protein
MPDDASRRALVSQIEEERISAAEAWRRVDAEVEKRQAAEAAKAAQALREAYAEEEKKRQSEEPDATNDTLLVVSPVTSRGNADDADFKENDAQLASRDHETRGQNAGQGGVGSSAPASSGVGFSTASSEGQNLKPAQFKRDLVEDELRPTVETLAKVARDMNDSAPFTTDAEERASKLLERLHQLADSLANTLDYSRKLREINEKQPKP